MKVLLFNHRHMKNDPHLADLLIDFDVVRDPAYKYSKKAQERIMSYPVFSFLLAWFPIHHESMPRKEKNTEDVKKYIEEMKKEIQEIGQMAEG